MLRASLLLTILLFSNQSFALTPSQNCEAAIRWMRTSLSENITVEAFTTSDGTHYRTAKITGEKEIQGFIESMRNAANVDFPIFFGNFGVLGPMLSTVYFLGARPFFGFFPGYEAALSIAVLGGAWGLDGLRLMRRLNERKRFGQFLERILSALERKDFDETLVYAIKAHVGQKGLEESSPAQGTSSPDHDHIFPDGTIFDLMSPVFLQLIKRFPLPRNRIYQAGLAYEFSWDRNSDDEFQPRLSIVLRYTPK